MLQETRGGWRRKGIGQKNKKFSLIYLLTQTRTPAMNKDEVAIYNSRRTFTLFNWLWFMPHADKEKCLKIYLSSWPPASQQTSRRVQEKVSIMNLECHLLSVCSYKFECDNDELGKKNCPFVVAASALKFNISFDKRFSWESYDNDWLGNNLPVTWSISMMIVMSLRVLWWRDHVIELRP